MVVAIVAVGLLGHGAAAPPAARAPPADVAKGVRVALASGVAIGGFLVALGQTSAAAGPVAAGGVAQRVGRALHRRWRWARGRRWSCRASALAPAIACGGLDMVANALYLVAVREGQLSLVATLASLYPASTVLLARVVLGERLGRWQQLGVASAVAAIVLIVGNS